MRITPSFLRKILSILWESALPDGFEGFDEPTSTPANSSALDKAYQFIHSLKKGDRIRVGRVMFEVRRNFGIPDFIKVGTIGSKWYRIEYYADGTYGMYVTGGSNQRVGSDEVRGFAVKV